MGADLFESFVGAILATIVLGYALATTGGGDAVPLMMYPLALAAAGIIASLIGTFRVKTDDETKLAYGQSVKHHFIASIATMSPSFRRPIGPPTAASGPTWPMQRPRVPPEKRPSVMSATFSMPRP